MKKEKVLMWVVGKGYSLFHDWISGPISKNKGKPVIDCVTLLLEADRQSKELLRRAFEKRTGCTRTAF